MQSLSGTSYLYTCIYNNSQVSVESVRHWKLLTNQPIALWLILLHPLNIIWRGLKSVNVVCSGTPILVWKKWSTLLINTKVTISFQNIAKMWNYHCKWQKLTMLSSDYQSEHRSYIPLLRGALLNPNHVAFPLIGSEMNTHILYYQSDYSYSYYYYKQY